MHCKKNLHVDTTQYCLVKLIYIQYATHSDYSFQLLSLIQLNFRILFLLCNVKSLSDFISIYFYSFCLKSFTRNLFQPFSVSCKLCFAQKSLKNLFFSLKRRSQKKINLINLSSKTTLQLPLFLTTLSSHIKKTFSVVKLANCFLL